MYLKPRQVCEKYLVEEKLTRINEAGRQVIEFKPTGDIILGAVSALTKYEIEKWKSLKHTVDKVIIQHLGHAKAKVGDRLTKGNKKFLVQAVEDIIGAGQFFLYYVEERFD